jgi:hypothetical protein
VEDVLLAGVLSFTIIGLPIVAFTGLSIFKRWLKYQELKLENEMRIASLNAECKGGQLNDMEIRLRVLERIATDKSTRLAAEIEDLREPAN